MTRSQLVQQIKLRKSYLCVGLDTDRNKIPERFKYEADGMFQFNKAIIDATRDLCVSYKLNTAFYEAEGIDGWKAMEQTVNYIGSAHFIIADAKRGDIGNTSNQYARAFFEQMNFDAITIAPYMGRDSVEPFLNSEGKWGIVLGLTSNSGANDFEMLNLEPGMSGADGGRAEKLYERVISTVASWGNIDNLMFVTGATKANEFLNIRSLVPEHFLLVPGVGFQGGSLEEISTDGLNCDGGLLVNVSRSIIYAGNGERFDEEARVIAKEYQKEMEGYLLNAGII